MAAPKRKIAKAYTEFAALEKRGHKFNILLECGHWTKMNKTDIRSGHAYCFDCYYGKEVDTLARIELENINN